MHILSSVSVLAAASAANSIAAPPTPESPQLGQVISNLTTWLVSFLTALATLSVTLGGCRYLLAGDDPGEIEKAKSALRAAAIGYSVAALAPVLVAALRSIVGV